MDANHRRWVDEAAALRIPPLRLPSSRLDDQYAKSPSLQARAARLDTWLADWAHTHGLAGDAEARATMAARRYGQVTVLCFPYASEEIARFLGQSHLLGFEMDDTLEPQGGDVSLGTYSRLLEIQEALTRYWETPPTPRPVPDALRDHIRLGEQLTSPRLFESFREGWSRYLFGVTCENALQSTRGIPSVTDYLRIRQFTIGDHLIPCVQLARSTEMLPSTLRQAPLADLNTSAMQAFALINDLLTCRAEIIDGHRSVNLPLVMAHHDGCTLQKAVDRVAQHYDDTIEKFICAAQASRSLRDLPEAGEYADGFAQAIRGWHDWTQRTVRYRCE